MEYRAEIRRLSNSFYADYPEGLFPEILRKDARAYTCLLIDLHTDYLICLPFRSRMVHTEGFHFSNTVRSSKTPSGLDYKKMVLIKDARYVDGTAAIIDVDEFKEVRDNLDAIVAGAVKYIDTYVQHANKSCILHDREYRRLFQYSTLSYFHDILGI